ncbi:hypothetical protein [Bacillus sp. EB01]|uniref:hypothetical protein n=1 Tax=Bacillus sp. EB01 TaxID=1347086 RepID=UPI0005C71C24|nr:hypothetical protein [Bacillus sp. EB01]
MLLKFLNLGFIVLFPLFLIILSFGLYISISIPEDLSPQRLWVFITPIVALVGYLLQFKWKVIGFVVILFSLVYHLFLLEFLV